MHMQMDFEGQWVMLMGILPDGAGAADMLCRILVAIDEDIVSLDIPRSPDGIKASMEFKVIIQQPCVISPPSGLPSHCARVTPAGLPEQAWLAPYGT